MMERLERMTSLGTEYAATVAALARTEVRQDVERIKKSLLATAAGVAFVVLGGLWLNIALLLFLLRTPYPDVAALLIGAVALILGVILLARARRGTEHLRMLEATRRVLADEFGSAAEPPPPTLGPPAPPAPMMPAEASARLREIREEMRETVSLSSSHRVEYVNARGEVFQPRSRTMRTLLWVWEALPRVPSGTAVAGALGLLAVSSPTLRRLLAVAALARNLGGSMRRTI
jgi:hypothetical protein